MRLSCVDGRARLPSGFTNTDVRGAGAGAKVKARDSRVRYSRPTRAADMASTNGVITPPTQSDHLQPHSPTDSAERKRKREDDVSHDRASSEDAQAQRDILDLLRQYVKCVLFLWPY